MVVLFGALLTGLAYGYWMMALPRPYGMLTDPQITERMATASVIASTGDPTQTSHSKDPNPHAHRDWVLAVLKPEPRTLIAFFRLGPVLLTPLLALVLFWIHPKRSHALVTSVSILLFWPAGSQMLSEEALLPPILFWGDPWGGLGLCVMVVGAVALDHRSWWVRVPVAIPCLLLACFLDPNLSVVLFAFCFGALLLQAVPQTRADAWPALALSLTAAVVLIMKAMSSSPPELSIEGAVVTDLWIWATLGQPIWVALGILAVKRRPISELRPGHRMLAGSVALLLAHEVGLFPIPLGSALATYRLGLIYSAAPMVSELTAAFGRQLFSNVPPKRSFIRSQAMILVVAGVLSPLYTFRPFFTYLHYQLSCQPISLSQIGAAQWVHENTPPDAVFVADRDLASILAIVSGRRLLRTDGLPERPDDLPRRRVEARLLGGRRAHRMLPAARRFGVTHLAVNRAAGVPGLITEPSNYEGRRPFKKIHQMGSWFFLFEIVDES